jgi:hypothetical protein
MCACLSKTGCDCVFIDSNVRMSICSDYVYYAICMYLHMFLHIFMHAGLILIHVCDAQIVCMNASMHVCQYVHMHLLCLFMYVYCTYRHPESAFATKYVILNQVDKTHHHK